MGLSLGCVQKCRLECSLCESDLSEDIESGRSEIALFGAAKYYFCPKCGAKPPVEDTDPQWKRWCKKVDNLLKRRAAHAVDNGDGTGSLKGKLVGMGF